MRPCENCGADFPLPYSTSEQRFCSRACAKQGRRTGRTEIIRWTDSEIGELCEMDHLSARAAAEALGRTAQSVQHMRNKLRRGWSFEKETWTESEVDFVRATPDFTAAQVAKHLGRTRAGVEHVRKTLSDTEGADFSRGHKKSPHHVGTRRLIAKTCLGCGLLLEASWFSHNITPSKRSKVWKARCNRCHHDASKPRRESGYRKDGGKSAKASYEKLQAITREHATRHGQPWLGADHEVLRNPDLTTFEKAIQLGRTWAATHQAVSQNGYTSRVGKGDPMKGRWVIDNPNEAALAA